MNDVALANGERLLDTRNNSISLGTRLALQLYCTSPASHAVPCARSHDAFYFFLGCHRDIDVGLDVIFSLCLGNAVRCNAIAFGMRYSSNGSGVMLAAAEPGSPYL